MKFTTLTQGAVMATLVLILCTANSTGPAANLNYYTGAPSTGGGTEFTCRICHNSGAGDFGEPQVNWTIAATENGPNVTTYVPGETYYITVNVSAPMGSPAGYGFSSTFLQDGTIINAGTPDNADENTQVTNAANGRTYVEHNKRTPSGTWNFEWTAPSNGTGVVKIYSAGNAVNGADGPGGDSGSNSPTIITLTETLLPVDLAEFSAVADKTTVDLHWSTDAEDNVSHFQVERSTDGATFAPIGSLPAFGNTRQARDYAFTDQEAPAGNLYYRLRMTDQDDAYTFGPVVQVRTTGSTELLVYPNPATTTVFVEGEIAVTGIIRILDHTGRILRSRRGVGSLDISDLSTGVYLVETIQEGVRSVRKLVKH